MNILLLTGSPRKNGSTFLLAEEFTAGAREAGHTVQRFDAAFAEIHPCVSCYSCAQHGMQCALQDDMEVLKQQLLAADMLVIATPIYYFGFPAQLKVAMDRFNAFNAALMRQRKKAMLLLTCADVEDWISEPIRQQYKVLLRYMGWEDCGILTASGLMQRRDLERTDYPARAREMGYSLH